MCTTSARYLLASAISRPLSAYNPLISSSSPFTPLTISSNSIPSATWAMFGDVVLGALNLKMVEVARIVGAVAKFTGSGGAVVAFSPDGASQAKLLEDACNEVGFVIQLVKFVPSCLNELDLKTLPSQFVVILLPCALFLCEIDL